MTYLEKEMIRAIYSSDRSFLSIQEIKWVDQISKHNTLREDDRRMLERIYRKIYGKPRKTHA